MSTFKQAHSCLTAILLGVLTTTIHVSANAEEWLFGIDVDTPFLDLIEPSTGQIISSRLLILEQDQSGTSVEFGSGLAVHPDTNEMYAAVKLVSQPTSSRTLIRIDIGAQPGTGNATVIGTLSPAIAGMTFTENGVL